MLPREMLEGFFDEKKVRVLKVLVNNPEEKFYLRELGRAAKVPPATTYRIINQLKEMKIVGELKLKKTKFYHLDDNSQVDALKDIFEEKKTAIQEFTEFTSKLDNVLKIILHGEEARDKTSILIIGENIDSGSIKTKVGEIKDKYGVSIIELTVGEEQFRQMSTMGLFPGKKQILWPKD